MPNAPTHDPELLDALARVFAEAALERLIAEATAQQRGDGLAKQGPLAEAKKKSTPA